MLLIGPVALKLGSTGYRFIRYYTGNLSYRRVGPPPALLRVIAPMVVLSTVVVMASGVALLFAGPQSRDTLLPIHKVSFVVWAAFTGIHVLGHLPAVPTALRADYGASAQWSHDATGRAGRVLSLAGALTAGVVLAILVIPEFGPWLHASGAVSPPPLRIEMRHHATNTRDAALRKLARINRWLIAGSVALTAVLSEVAAQAFPGKSARQAHRAQPPSTRAARASQAAPDAPNPAGATGEAPSTTTEAAPETVQEAPQSAEAPAESAPAPESAQEPSAPQEPAPESAPPAGIRSGPGTGAPAGILGSGHLGWILRCSRATLASAAIQ